MNLSLRRPPLPGQLIRPDCVHEIPNGARVEISKDGKVTGDVTMNGQVIAHYDACPEAPIPTRHTASASNTPGHTPGLKRSTKRRANLEGMANHL